MCEKVTETTGRGFSESQLLLVALQCGKQIEIADLLSCVHHKLVTTTMGWNSASLLYFLLVLWELMTFSVSFGIFPFPVSMVSLLNLVNSFSSFSWNHSTFAELQICALTAERMDLHFSYMPISKSQDKKTSPCGFLAATQSRNILSEIRLQVCLLKMLALSTFQIQTEETWNC